MVKLAEREGNSFTVCWMGDIAAPTVQAPAPTTAPQPAPALPGGGRAGRAERRTGAISKVQSAISAEAPAAPAVAQPAAAAPKAVEPPKAAEAPKTLEQPKPDEKPDPSTERGLRQLEAAKKKWLDEQNAAKAELDVQRAEIARLRKEAEGKVTSAKDLEGLSPKDLIAKFAHYTDADWHALSRLSYAITKEGKADPRAAQAAQDAERALGSRATADKVAELEAKYEKQIADLKEQFASEFTRRDNASFASRWLEDATKAIPTDKPSFASKQFANDPDGTRAELLAIGQELEKSNDGIAPTHAEVIAEFEKRKVAALRALGLDPDALLAPPKPAPAPAPTTRTLNPIAPTITRPENAPKTREERRVGALAKVRASARTTADQLP